MRYSRNVEHNKSITRNPGKQGTHFLQPSVQFMCPMCWLLLLLVRTYVPGCRYASPQLAAACSLNSLMWVLTQFHTPICKFEFDAVQAWKHCACAFCPSGADFPVQLHVQFPHPGKDIWHRWPCNTRVPKTQPADAIAMVLPPEQAADLSLQFVVEN